MIMRERYMRLIRDFMDKPVVKIITGMRRSGKSALLELTRQELLSRGIDGKNIFSLTCSLCAMKSSETTRHCTQILSKKRGRQRGGSIFFSTKSRR